MGEPLVPFDTWARTHNLIPVGSQLVFTASKDGRTHLFFVNMAVPTQVPDNVDAESFMRSTWLTSAEAEREKLRADGWVVTTPLPEGCTLDSVDPSVTMMSSSVLDSNGVLHTTYAAYTNEHGVRTTTVREPEPPTREEIIALIRQAEWSADCQGEPACPWCRAEKPDCSPTDQFDHMQDCPVVPVLYPAEKLCSS